MRNSDTFFTFNNLYGAYLGCRKRKTHTLNHLVFAENLEQNLLELESQLQNRTYRPGRSIAFVVRKPKIREIFAADFRDRVVHHLLIDYLAPIFERFFIFDSWACRKDKGTHRAMKRLKHFVAENERERERERERSASPTANQQAKACSTKTDPVVQGLPCPPQARAWSTTKPHYLQMDIKSYFMSIDQSILYGLLAKKIKKEEILWLARTIIFHDCARDIRPKIQSPPTLFDKLPREKSLFKVAKGKGLPIGNLTSQFFANVYLNELDQFVKHKLKAKYYLRYVDDFLILDRDKEKLKFFQKSINDFLGEKLALTAHPDKQFIRYIANGIDFVGYFIKPEYVLIRRRVVGQYHHRLIQLTGIKRAMMQASLSSYRAHFSYANAHWLTYNTLSRSPCFGFGLP